MTTGDVPPSPEAAGIPDHADDDSTAFEDGTDRLLRDSPPALPADRPQAIDEARLTAAEQREGESIEEQLAREEPDVSAEPSPPADRRPGAAERSAEEAALRVEGGDHRGLPEEDVPYEP